MGEQRAVIVCHMGNKADIDACMRGEHPHCDRVRHDQFVKCCRDLGKRMRQRVEANAFKLLRGELPISNLYEAMGY